MNYLTRLEKYRKKTITREDLASLFDIYEDNVLYEIISSLSQYLQPIVSSATNGSMKYPIYNKYHIILNKEPDQKLLAEIQSLHPLLHGSSWLIKHPQDYERFSLRLKQLSTWFFQHGKDTLPVSRKERSFEIFNEEKMLEEDTGLPAVLRKIGLTKEDLYFYNTPEYCFHDFIPVRKENMTLLILENKDIWFNLRRIFFEENKHTLFGTAYDGLVYGAGNGVTTKNALAESTNFLGLQQVHYLYWGDLDREGLNIFLRLCENNTQSDIKLFVPAYQNMLAMSIDRQLPDSEDKREKMDDYTQIYASLGTYAFQAEKYIQENKRLPQEIISYAVLKERMDK